MSLRLRWRDAQQRWRCSHRTTSAPRVGERLRAANGAQPRVSRRERDFHACLTHGRTRCNSGERSYAPVRDAVCDSLMTRQLVARRGPWVHSQPRRTARRRARRTCASRPPCAARRVSFPFRQRSGRAECGPVRRSLRTIAKPVVHHALLCRRRCCDVDASESVCAATNDAQPRVARRNQDMMCVWRTGERAAIRRSARTRRCAAWCVTRSRHSCLLHAAVRGYAHRRGAQRVDERAGRRRLAHTPCAARHASFPFRQDYDRSAYGPVRRSMRTIAASVVRHALPPPPPPPPPPGMRPHAR